MQFPTCIISEVFSAPLKLPDLAVHKAQDLKIFLSVLNEISAHCNYVGSHIVVPSCYTFLLYLLVIPSIRHFENLKMHMMSKSGLFIFLYSRFLLARTTRELNQL
jgi:hypothetical protein